MRFLMLGFAALVALPVIHAAPAGAATVLAQYDRYDRDRDRPQYDRDDRGRDDRRREREGAWRGDTNFRNVYGWNGQRFDEPWSRMSREEQQRFDQNADEMRRLMRRERDAGDRRDAEEIHRRVEALNRENRQMLHWR